jgi:pilus assembly protein CpaE
MSLQQVQGFLCFTASQNLVIAAQLAQVKFKRWEITFDNQDFLRFSWHGESRCEIGALAKDLLAQVPESVIAGAFTPDHLEHGQSEGATIIELLRAQLRDFLRRPLSTTELRAVLDRLFSRLPGTAPAAQGRVAAFISNKGGVGKSMLAVNVACALALRHPDEVLLIDTSLQIGTCSMLLDLKPTTSIVDAIRERDRLDKTLLRHLTLRHGTGLRLLAAPTDALEGAEVDDEAISRIINMARRSSPRADWRRARSTAVTAGVRGSLTR